MVSDNFQKHTLNMLRNFIQASPKLHMSCVFRRSAGELGNLRQHIVSHLTAEARERAKKLRSHGKIQEAGVLEDLVEAADLAVFLHDTSKASLSEMESKVGRLLELGYPITVSTLRRICKRASRLFFDEDPTRYAELMVSAVSRITPEPGIGAHFDIASLSFGSCAPSEDDEPADFEADIVAYANAWMEAFFSNHFFTTLLEAPKNSGSLKALLWALLDRMEEFEEGLERCRRPYMAAAQRVVRGVIVLLLRRLRTSRTLSKM